MVRIKKDKLRATVTRGAYESIFKRQGWEIYEGTNFMDEKTESALNMNLSSPDYEEDTQDEFRQESEEDLTERPISSLSLDELKTLADMYGIDTEDLHTKREYKAAIREYMERG